MAMEMEDFKFPDEEENDEVTSEVPSKEELNAAPDIEIEIEDDTPEQDRGREAVSPEEVKKIELETDELDAYSKQAKDKLIKMKRVWHDERRAKEQAMRENQEAVALAKRLIEENKKLRTTLDTGGKQYAETLQNAATLELEIAKRAYREAYDAGDADKIVEAQEAMQNATLKVAQAKNFRPPSLQEEREDVQTQVERYDAPPPPDQRVLEWRDRNAWFGPNRSMTAYALGLHEEMRDGGVAVGSDEYYATLDKTMRKRFPEYFESIGEKPRKKKDKGEDTRTKPSTVVAPATRSTASNKIRLSASQVQLAKKLGLTPEQYALAQRKLENQNG